MLYTRPSILQGGILFAQGPIDCIEVLPERVPGLGYKSPFEKNPYYRDDWWGHVPYDYAKGGIELLSFRDAGAEVARARILRNQTLNPGYGVPRPAARYVTVAYFEVDARHRRQGKRVGTRAVGALIARYRDFGVLAYSQDADAFWDTIGWQRYEHVEGTRSFAPLYVRTPQGR